MLFVMLKNDFIIYKDPVNNLYAYLPLSSCPGMTSYQFICHDAKGEEGGDPGLNIIMTLIF